MIGINPDNGFQGCTFLCTRTAYEDGEKRHPQTIMRELSEELSFKILRAVPQIAFDGWEFWIEFDNKPKLPKYFRKISWELIKEQENW